MDEVLSRKYGMTPDEATAANLRMTEFQAALILRGIETFEAQMAVRDENTAHLRARLAEIEAAVNSS